MAMSKELKEELEYRVNAKMESVEQEQLDYPDESVEVPSRESLEIEALEDIDNLGPDFGGNFTLEGSFATLVGTPEEVAAYDKANREYVADIAKQKKEWCKLRREAMRELRRRTQ